MGNLKQRKITLGDPVPDFTAQTIAGATVSLQVDAGRWVVLAFLGSLDEPRAAHEVAELLAEARHFAEDRLVVYGILSAPPSPAPCSVCPCRAWGCSPTAKSPRAAARSCSKPTPSYTSARGAPEGRPMPLSL